MAKSPPVERMVEWAYKLKLSGPKTPKAVGGKAKGKGKGNPQISDGPKEKNKEPTEEQLMKLRQERLAALN